MFKVMKYIFLANTYKRAKSSFIMLFVSFVSLIVFSFIMSDIINVSHGIYTYLFLLLKWSVIIALLVLILYSILKIVNVMSTPFSSKREVKGVMKKNERLKKEQILSKEKLYTQSDLIVQKYMKDQ